uniref:Integrase, catalytic region, zinc finger, CCHC-type, peptidase aspartic, catalytic n=1 Tax=Tanacetum cinerariifolium TaxID=118510 RepID=A0A699L9B0_TANCI|nr:hypothetical protein [Tanacetum cinerariifolium]
MVLNHYLDEAKKKTQERDRNSKPSVMTPARFQSTPANSKPKPRSTNHSSRSLPMSKSSCVTIPTMPKADHSKSPRHKFSPNKTSAVYEKISPRSDLRWQPTGRIFKSVGLRWLPTGKLFDSCTSKVKSEPTHGSNVDISKIHECKQTLDLSACTSINVPKEQNLYASAGILWNVNKENLRTMALNHDSLSPAIQRQEKVTQADRTVTTSNELDLLFSPMFDELLNGSSKVVFKYSVISAADAPNQRQQYTTPLNNHTTPAPSCQIPTLAPTVISPENINQAETYAENDQVADDEFINIFSNPVQDQGETSTRHVNSLNMHTFYQRRPLSLHQSEGRKSKKVLVSRQTTWYEMFDSSGTGGSGK